MTFLQLDKTQKQIQKAVNDFIKVESYFRDAKVTDIFDGTSIVQKNIIASVLVKGKKI